WRRRWRRDTQYLTTSAPSTGREPAMSNQYHCNGRPPGRADEVLTFDATTGQFGRGPSPLTKSAPADAGDEGERLAANAWLLGFQAGLPGVGPTLSVYEPILDDDAGWLVRFAPAGGRSRLIHVARLEDLLGLLDRLLPGIHQTLACRQAMLALYPYGHALQP